MTSFPLQEIARPAQVRVEPAGLPPAFANSGNVTWHREAEELPDELVPDAVVFAVKPQIIEWGPYYQQLNARIAAHDIPTIAVMHTAQLGDYTRYVEPLDDLLKEAGIDAADFTANARAGVTVGGKIYAMPCDTHSWLWHFNIGLFTTSPVVGSYEEGE